MAGNKVKGFSFYKSYYEALDNFDDEDKKELVFAIINYVFEDKEPSYKKKDMKNLAWTLIKPNLDKSKNKSNSNAGAPIGNQNARKYEEETNEKQSNDNQTFKDNSLSISLSNSLSLSLSNIIINNNNNKDNIYNLFKEYINIRNKKKYIINNTVLKRLVNKLNEYGKNDEDKIEILEQAINGAWKDLYAIDNKKNNKRKIL